MGRPSEVSATTASAIGAATGKDVLYQEHVSPQWVRLLEVLQMNARYTRC